MADTQDAAVKTYVTQAEKAEWKAQADQLDMSLAEYVRSMVNAGNRNFDLQPIATRSEDANPRGQPIETRVLQTIRVTDYPSWSELEESFPEIDGERLSEVLQSLQAENRIEHDGPNGGYTLIDDE